MTSQETSATANQAVETSKKAMHVAGATHVAGDFRNSRMAGCGDFRKRATHVAGDFRCDCMLQKIPKRQHMLQEGHMSQETSVTTSARRGDFRRRLPQQPNGLWRLSK